jgi:hypothetical protein
VGAQSRSGRRGGEKILDTTGTQTPTPRLCLRSFLNIRDQVPHPYKTTVEIIIACILISVFVDSRRDANSGGVNIKHFLSRRSDVCHS